MHQSAFAFAETYLTNLEGNMPCMYPDIKGLVTTSIGVLLPLDDALRLKWRKKLAPIMLASQEEIRREWNRMNGNMVVADYKNRRKYEFAELVLAAEDLDNLFNRKLVQFDGIIRSRFANYDKLNADQQLLITCGIAWGVGPWFRWPKFIKSVGEQDFPTMYRECYTTQFTAERNAANRVLVNNSAVVAARGLDPSILYYPRDLKKEPVNAS